MSKHLRYLLLQARRQEDPMREQERTCFLRALDCPPARLTTWDLIPETSSGPRWTDYDVILLGGSGNYSVVDGGPWLTRVLETIQEIYQRAIPTFASCWGFQLISKALGGDVITNLDQAELGTTDLTLTSAGESDPVFGSLPVQFQAQMGHQDIVTRLPSEAVLLASTDRVENEAFCFPDKGWYCTQFHPELRLADLVERLTEYPEYVERIAGIPLAEFLPQCRETPGANALLSRFIEQLS
jgi:GMP synthase (glutamine-hydrolysing)